MRTILSIVAHRTQQQTMDLFEVLYAIILLLSYTEYI
jgi:hypothetical protein